MAASTTCDATVSSPQSCPELFQQGTTTCMGDLIAVTTSDPADLTPMVESWGNLAAHAETPNVFYAPAFFQSAVDSFAQDEHWRLTLIRNAKTDQLVAFFPFVRKRGILGLRLLSLWVNEFSFLTSPLIRSGDEAATFQCLFAHLRNLDEHFDAIEFPKLLAEGASHEALLTYLRSHLHESFTCDHYCRADFPAGYQLEEYLKQTIRGHHLREYRRQERKLNEMGQLELRSSRDPHFASCWADWYLQLEAAGWKGEEGTALGESKSQTAFFQQLIHEGSCAGNTEMVGLFLNGEPIAISCLLFLGRGAYTYKIAYDESYRKYSPGILLMLKIMQRFLSSEEHDWIDSCAVPDHPMINRLWKDRRPIQHLLVSSGNRLANFRIAALPLLRALKRQLRPTRSTE